MKKLKDSDIWFLNKMRSSIQNFDVTMKGKKVTDISLQRKKFGRSKYQVTFDNGTKSWVDPNKLVYETKVGERNLGI